MLNAESRVTKEITSAFKEWESIDLALLSLLIVSLSNDAIEYVIGCRTVREVWSNLEERYVSVSKTGVNHLKTKLHTIQKGGDTRDKYLLKLKSIRDQLTSAGEFISDIMIAALASLPNEYATIRTMILARDTTIFLKEF